MNLASYGWRRDLFGLDHLLIWTDRRERVFAFLSERLGMDILNGFSPTGLVISRGVRFMNGPFLDVHQLGRTPPGFDRAFHRLLALRGPISEASRLADQSGWKSKITPQASTAASEAHPYWSTLAFLRGQGLVSDLLVIDYVRPDVTDQGGALFEIDRSNRPGVTLERVWMPVEDQANAAQTLLGLGARPLGMRISPSPPCEGEAFFIGSCELVVCPPWGPDRSLRLDLHHPSGLTMEASPVPGLTILVNAVDEVLKTPIRSGEP